MGRKNTDVGAVALIAPLRMVVLATEDDDVVMIRQGLRPRLFRHLCDSEERQVVFVGGKALPLAQNVEIIDC